MLTADNAIEWNLFFINITELSHDSPLVKVNTVKISPPVAARYPSSSIGGLGKFKENCKVG